MTQCGRPGMSEMGGLISAPQAQSRLFPFLTRRFTLGYIGASEEQPPTNRNKSTDT